MCIRDSAYTYPSLVVGVPSDADISLDNNKAIPNVHGAIASEFFEADPTPIEHVITDTEIVINIPAHDIA